MMRARAIECALHDRVFTLQVGARTRSWRGLFLTSGSGAIRSSDSEFGFEAMDAVWTPWDDDMSVHIAAGSVGYQLGVTDDTLSNAVSHNAESTELRLLAESRILVGLNRGTDDAEDAEHAFRLIVRESAQSSKGAATMAEAQLRALLVVIWRNATALGTVAGGYGRTRHVLQQFRQLLETHFRDRWQIGRYAHEIGVSPDRLHDICTRRLGRSPSALVQERVLHEATQMLVNTTLSAEQVSIKLGFRDASYFSRFIRTKTGVPPAAYRDRAASQAASDRSGEQSYADWP